MIRVAAVAIVAVATTALAAQDKSTLGTRVSVAGNDVAVTWDKNHPWDAQLSRSGAELVAEYEVGNRGVVSESLARAASGGANRTFRFTLPANLKGEPSGVVCLYVQPAGSRTVLPIRKATREGADTARFRYEEWEKSVRQHVDLVAAGRRVQALERDEAAAAQRLQAQQSAVETGGWSAAGACDAIPARNATGGATPYDIVAAPQQDETARRVCVHRVWSGRQLADRKLERYAKEVAGIRAGGGGIKVEAFADILKEGVFGFNFIVPEAAGALLEELRKAGTDAQILSRRSAQAAEFRADWNRFSPTSGDYAPQLGAADDVLGWGAETAPAALSVMARDMARRLKVDEIATTVAPATLRDLSGVIGASLDGYSGCLEDSRKQLKIKYDNWQALQTSAPQRAIAEHDFLVRECRQAVSTRDQLQAADEALKAKLAAEREAEAALQKVPPLPTTPRVVNNVACAVR